MKKEWKNSGTAPMRADAPFVDPAEPTAVLPGVLSGSIQPFPPPGRSAAVIGKEA